MVKETPFLICSIGKLPGGSASNALDATNKIDAASQDRDFIARSMN